MYRIEEDTMGQVRVPKNQYWGAQTQRSLENFQIGSEKIPEEVIRALAIVKRAAATTNAKLGLLEEDLAKTIAAVADEILAGQLQGNFPLAVWQTGSGTQTNMNVNEVIAHRGNELLGAQRIHANDHVNKSQSSNDTFPTAMHIAAILAIKEKLLPVLHDLEKVLEGLMLENADLIKTGRTHLQDAVPLTLGQEISGWLEMVSKTREMIESSSQELRFIALGGTAVGTGLNTHPEFAEAVAQEISRITGENFSTSTNKFHALTSMDAIVYSHGALKALAANLMKIANDVRWLASGPRCGIGEITIPENEPGSSIMPGKVNPTQAEALTMVVCQVFGNDASIGFAASQGNFQLNVFMPVIIYNFLQSVNLLADASKSFNKNCCQGIRPNREKIQENLDRSLMLVTALNPHIGYVKAASIAKKAHAEGITLKEAAIELGLLTGEEFDQMVDPRKMLAPSK